jgi:hypothetical protein
MLVRTSKWPYVPFAILHNHNNSPMYFDAHLGETPSAWSVGQTVIVRCGLNYDERKREQQVTIMLGGKMRKMFIDYYAIDVAPTQQLLRVEGELVTSRSLMSVQAQCTRCGNMTRWCDCATHPTSFARSSISVV